MVGARSTPNPAGPLQSKTMHKLTPIAALIALLTLTLPLTAQEDASTNLQPKWSVGQKAVYDFWIKTEKEETATLFGQTKAETTKYLTEGSVTWSVEQVDADGSASCTMQITKMKFTVTGADQQQMVIDSENPTGERAVFDDLMRAMTNTPLTVKVNADGTIQAVEGVEELNTAAGQEAIDAEIVPEELDFKETASDMASLLAAPASATVGQTWNTKNTWNHDNVLPGADTLATWDTTHTFHALGNIAGIPIATIKTESAVDIEVDLSELPENAPDIDVQISDASGKGEVLFDLSRNEAVARNDTMTYTANITVQPPNDKIPPIKIKVVEKSHSQMLRVSESLGEDE